VNDQEVDTDGEVVVSRESHLRKQGLATAGSLLAVAFALLVPPPGAEAASAEMARSSGKSLTYKTKTFRMSGPDEKRRLVVRCPGRLIPFGGGMKSDPLPGSDGEGVYPHSYERLGVQRGFHTTPVLFDPSKGSTTPRNVTLQVVCGKKRRHVTPPHTTVYVNPGQTKTIQATCPGRRFLFGGGFQRTDFVSRGGDYVTESRAVSPKTWQVTGSASGGFGGELTAIAYCRRSKKPLVKEVASAPTAVGQRQYGTATTPPCPGRRRMVFGGFSTFPPAATFFTDGFINTAGAFTASAFDYFGPAAMVTAYGYCAKV
jgi:hypothetical protein